MKREKVKKCESLKMFIPLLKWAECDDCGNEFRGERMWTADGLSLCMSCAPNSKAAHKYFVGLTENATPPQEV